MSARHRADHAPLPPMSRRASARPGVQLRWGSLVPAVAAVALLTTGLLVTNAHLGDGLTAESLARAGTTDGPTTGRFAGVAATGSAAGGGAGPGTTADVAGSAADAGNALGVLAADGVDVPEPGAGPPLALPAAGTGTPSDPSNVPPAAPAVAAGDIPPIAAAAYRDAAAATALARPDCHIDWSLLAAIGRVESDHGRFGGSQLGVDGVARPPILGPRLDGHLAGTGVVRDTDHGRLDGDPVYDRAVGPMQFLPGTWAAVGVAARSGAVADPQNIRDAALAAARYLCRAGGDLSTGGGRRAAVLAYNPSQSYADTVLALAAGYAGRPAPPPGAGDAPGAPAGPAAGAVTVTVTVTTHPPSTDAPAPTSTPPTGAPGSTSPSTSSPASTSSLPPTSSTASSSGSPTTPSPTSATAAPSPDLALAPGEKPGTLTLHWTAAAPGPVRVSLERFEPADGTWSVPAPADEVTLAPGDPREHTWSVTGGRYRAVVQPLDPGHPDHAVGAALLSAEVTVAAAADAVSGARRP